MLSRLQPLCRGNQFGRLTTSIFAFAMASAAGNALADEPKKVNEPAVMREPSEIVQVADAFDDDDPFDLHLSLGYQSTWTSARIYRENSIRQEGLTTGGYTTANMNVAKFEQRVSRLNTRADIGIFKDIALVVRMPVILSDDRELKGVEGSADQQSLILRGAPGEQLFSLPFKSPTRSGIEYLAVGIDFGLMSQARDATKPTWVFGIEGRFDVDEPMHACNANPGALNLDASVGQVECAHPSDVNRNGASGDVRVPDDANDPLSGSSLEGSFTGQRKPGVSRGVTGLEGHVYLSRRVKYIEPYGGFKALIEFQNDSSDYGATDLQGSLVNHPPLRGSMIAGIAVMPWEVRDAYQRLTLDFRFTGTYVSEGRDYSELYDALGSTDARSLRSPQYAEYTANTDPFSAGNFPSVADTNSQKVYFTGLTDVQQHGVYNLQGSVTYQAGEYVKFNAGGGYTFVQGHFVTFDQACNPDFSGDPTRSGPCRTVTAGTSTVGPVEATGIPNPNYRKVVNDPGMRFKVDNGTSLDAWISATVMF
jgi:hypothetical protein